MNKFQEVIAKSEDYIKEVTEKRDQILSDFSNAYFAETKLAPSACVLVQKYDERTKSTQFWFQEKEKTHGQQVHPHELRGEGQGDQESGGRGEADQEAAAGAPTPEKTRSADYHNVVQLIHSSVNDVRYRLLNLARSLDDAHEAFRQAGDSAVDRLSIIQKAKVLEEVIVIGATSGILEAKWPEYFQQLKQALKIWGAK